MPFECTHRDVEKYSAIIHTNTSKVYINSHELKKLEIFKTNWLAKQMFHSSGKDSQDHILFQKLMWIDLCLWNKGSVNLSTNEPQNVIYMSDLFLFQAI